MCSYTIVVANNSINRSGRAVSLAKSNVLWHTLLSSAADVSNKRIDAGVVGLSEIFLLLGIDDTLLDTHLIELLEITLSLLGLAL
jgi:pyruvate/2-oxoglutarate/acetoin dehydrogenase E1 component